MNSRSDLISDQLIYTPVVDPGRTIIRIVTATHNRLKIPVDIASRPAAAPPSTARCAGRMAATRTTAATAGSAIETSTQAWVNDPIETAVAIPRRGTATPTAAYVTQIRWSTPATGGVAE